MATLIKIDRNGSKHYEGMTTCDRCGGKGYYAIGTHNGQPVLSPLDGGVCWKCGGSGKVFGKWIERTPEYEAKLAAKRAEKAAKRAAENEAQMEQIRQAEELEKQRKEAEEARIKAQKAISKHVGQIGEKITTIGAYDHSAWFTAHLGWMENTVYIHTFKDPEGNVIIWKTQKGLDMHKGEPVEITGTVKEHSVYEDEKQTVLTRCKITRQ